MDRQKKIDEAIKRMKELKIFDDTIESFKKGKVSQSIQGFMYWIDENTENNLAQKIADFEAENNAVVYYVIASNTNFGMLYNLLFVGDNEEEWGMEHEDIADNYVFSYVINVDEPMFSEFGTIVVSQQYGGLVRVG
jgi:hypothetical protein